MVLVSSTGQCYTSTATWMLQGCGQAYCSTNAALLSATMVAATYGGANVASVKLDEGVSLEMLLGNLTCDWQPVSLRRDGDTNTPQDRYPGK